MNKYLIALVLCGISATYTDSRSVCSSEICRKAANLILENMNNSVDPCEDFYEFTCGNYKEKYMATQKDKNTFDDLQEIVFKQLKDLLSEKSNSSSKMYTTAKKYYALCMDKNKIHARGVKPVLDILKRGGGWPVLEERWNEQSWNLVETEIWLQSYLTQSGLFFIGINPNPKNSSRSIVTVDQPQLMLSKNLLADERYNNIIMQYLQQLPLLFGGNLQKAMKQQQETYEFVRRLSEITLKLENLRDQSKLNNLMTLGQVEMKWKWFDWSRLFKEIMPKNMSPLTEADLLLITNPSYLTQLDHLLHQFPPRVVANYLMSVAAQSMKNYLSVEMSRRLSFTKFMETSSGSEATTDDRWMTCVQQAVQNFNYAISPIYIKKYFKNKTKEGASKLIHQIRKEMVKLLEEVDWMNRNTKYYRNLRLL